MQKDGVRLLKRKEVLQKFGGVSKDSGYRHLFSRPDFPRPVKVFPGQDLWLEKEVDEFIERLVADRDATGAKAA